MKKLLITIFLLSSSLGLSQINNESYFSSGVDLYNQGKYLEAISQFELVIENGEHSYALYFNLGNSFYKINDIANSILFYEKSLKLDPTDKDVINNLKMVNNAIIDDIAKIPESFINNQFSKLSNNFSYSTWGLISIIFSFSFLLIFVLYFFSKEPIVKRTSFALLFILSLLIGSTLKISLDSYEKNHLEKYAIIFSSKIEIKAEPNMRSENLLTLHMGTKVKIINNFNDEWLKIKLVNGQEGWISKNEIKII